MSPSSNRPPANHEDLTSQSISARGFDIFRSRLESGDYDALLGRKLRSSLRQAAQETSLEPEIGALRLAMARLLREEQNPTRLANGISRLAGASIQAARIRPSSRPNDPSEVLKRVLAKIDAEDAAAGQQEGAFRAAPILLPIDQEIA